jgi:hypothetical protein
VLDVFVTALSRMPGSFLEYLSKPSGAETIAAVLST